MDFKGSWWKSWWRRRRGYQAFAQDFHEAIKAETAPMLSELKHDQAEAVRAIALEGMKAFLDEQRMILAGLSESGQIDKSGAQEMFANTSSTERKRALESTMETLNRCAA